MRRSAALVILPRQITHRCPFKGQDVPLALCYIGAQDGENEFCYGCEQVPRLKAKYGLRTFRRQVTVSRCTRCGEGPALHAKEPPYAGTRVTTCTGFVHEHDEGKLYVPTSLDCTTWMVVNAATGERLPYVEARKKWEGEAKARRFQVALLGAPDTVPSDSRDELRRELAVEAAKRRGRPELSMVDADGNTIEVARKKLKKSK